jgi:hypothetical protein
MKVGNTYYYAATIWRSNKRAIRQGTINAEDEVQAIERIYDLGREVWNRSVLEISLSDPITGEVVATSKIGDSALNKAVKSALPVPGATPKDPKGGFVPWNKPTETPFYASSIGTFFSPKTFNKLTGM